jgi:hypothetical protein
VRGFTSENESFKIHERKTNILKNLTAKNYSESDIYKKVFNVTNFRA